MNALEVFGGFVLALLGIAAVGSVITWWGTLGGYARNLRDRIDEAARTEKRFAEVEKIVRATRLTHDPRCSYKRWMRLTEEQREAGESGWVSCDCGNDLLHRWFNGYGVGGATLAEDIQYDTRAYLPGEHPAGYDPLDDAEAAAAAFATDPEPS